MTIRGSELREVVHRVQRTRRSLIDLGNSYIASVADVEAEPYLTTEEKEIQKRQARDTAKAALPGRVEAAHVAREAARDAAVRELDRRKPTDEATGRVARLLGRASLLERSPSGRRC